MNRWQKVMVGFAEVGDGLMAIISLGSLRLNLAFKLTARYAVSKLENT